MHIADEQSGLAEAEITSAHPLNDEDRAELEAQVAKVAGGRVRATYRAGCHLAGRGCGAHRIDGLRRLAPGAVPAVETKAGERLSFAGNDTKILR